MPYSRVEPVSEEVMLKQRYAGHHTICEVLREIYVATKNDEIKLKCRLGVAMAKKMHNRLKEYKEQSEHLIGGTEK